MPGIYRQVPFSPAPSSVPSASWTGSTASSQGLFTPAYNCQPLPDCATKLAVELATSTLGWDLSLRPEERKPDSFSQPATNPPLPFMTITLPTGHTIHIHASRGRSYVIVGDVVEGIYNALRRPLSGQEYNSFGSNERRLIDASFQRRYTRIRDPNSREMERQKGLKAVDLLFGRNNFRGLVGGPDCWTIQCS